MLGLAIVIFGLLYLANNLDEEHSILKLFFIVVIISIMFYVPKAALDTECKPIIQSYEDRMVYGNNFSGYHWDYADPLEVRPQDDEEAYIFHQSRVNNWSVYCYNSTTGNTNTSFLKNSDNFYRPRLAHSLFPLRFGWNNFAEIY